VRSPDMSDYQFALLVGLAVKAAIMASGLVIVFLGYRLFATGVYRGGAGVKIEGWKAVVAMDKGGPGLVFALFGAIVLVVGIAHPITARHDQVPVVEQSAPFRSEQRVTIDATQPSATGVPVAPGAVRPAGVPRPAPAPPVYAVHEALTASPPKDDLRP
jgi:hypothetical protein